MSGERIANLEKMSECPALDSLEKVYIQISKIVLNELLRKGPIHLHFKSGNISTAVKKIII